MVNTEGLTQAQVLAAMYNASKPLGMGHLHFDPKDMSVEEAGELLKSTIERQGPLSAPGPDPPYFDYLKGRVMKLRLNDPEQFDEHLYDRDNGPGAAQLVIDQLRHGL